MGKAQALRKEANALLAVSKDALRFLMRMDAPKSSDALANYTKLMEDLREVIDRADPPRFDDKNLSSFRLVMTNLTADEILHQLKERAVHNEGDGDVLQAVEEGMRRTKQRVYLRLGFNPVILRRLCFVLRHTGESGKDKAFKRLAVQIEEEGLSKNPMEVIAQMGL
jgi:hypothetical protein